MDSTAVAVMDVRLIKMGYENFVFNFYKQTRYFEKQ